MISYKLDDNEGLVLGRTVGEGGEAVVYALENKTSQVAKIYRKPDITRTAKLRAMLANPPADAPTLSPNHIAIAWPDQLVFDLERQCVGFVMPYIHAPTNLELSKLYNPQDRRQNAPGFTWKYLLRTARNIAQVLETLHESGHVVGDLNESNWLVSNAALVTLVDCDSIQVTVKNGSIERVYRCPVGKAEYTPPELQGCNFNLVNRNANHDNFGLAVLIFLLLMEGVHPFQSRWLGESEPPGIAESIERGLCPYVPEQTGVKPPLFGLPFNILTPALQNLMLRCFGDGYKNPTMRPTAAEWQQTLREAEENLTLCASNSQHYYSNHLTICPWCERVSKGLADSFPAKEQLTRLLQEAQLPRPKRPPAPPRARPVAINFTIPVPPPPPVVIAAAPRRNRSLAFVYTNVLIIVGLLAIIIRAVLFTSSSSYRYDPGVNQTMNAMPPIPSSVTDPVSYYGTNALVSNATIKALAGTKTPTPLALYTPIAPPHVTLAQTLVGHTGAVNAITFSADGQTLASGSSDKTVRLWDTSTGQPLPTMISNFSGVTSVSFNPLHKVLASGNAYNPVKLWNIDTGQEVVPVGGSLRYSNTVFYSPDGKTLVTTDAYDAAFYHIDPTTGRFDLYGTLGLASRRITRSVQTIVPLVFSPDSKMIAFEDEDHALSIVDVRSLSVLHTLYSHKDKVLGLAFGPDGKMLASASVDGSLIIWDTATGTPLHTMGNQGSLVSAVAFGLDGTIVASGDYAGHLKIWDTVTGRLLENVVTEPDRVLALAFTLDGKTLALAGADKTIELWAVSR